ncbi:MAG: YicC family protein [Candidatus Amoebophilus sp. 36-38]|nr:MAG: YicC family protein [Candidatus Amoebophilus sp. 36-38]
MLKSMTGFGKAIYEDEQLRVQIEVKSLNSKHADISLQVPKVFAEHAVGWKNLITAKLHRGKIDLHISYEYKQPANLQIGIQESLFKAYYNLLERLANEVGAPTNKIFQLALKSPGVMVSKGDSEVDASIQNKIEHTIQVALQKCDQARMEEGTILATTINTYLQKIAEGLASIEKLDPARSDAIKTKLKGKVESMNSELPIDEPRLEQELIYYLEKIDITEEKVRLATHLAYFENVMQTEELAGKKLGFIAQEIARELNTLGVKANDAAIQKHVIIMKNELEKIKEQLQNIL